VIVTGSALPAAAAKPGAAAPQAPSIPWLGIAAVLLGTFISTLTGRLSTFGLADIEGAVHAGFDQGAWITTSTTTAQMLVTPFAIWAGSLYGPRRVLLLASLVFAITSVLVPFSGNLTTLLALQFVGGLASGCFIPLTLSFILLRLPKSLWPLGIALYALHIELSLNISASLEGWYVDHESWRWIFWQNVPLAVAMAACLYFGVQPLRTPPPAGKFDFFGLLSFGLGLAGIYAALDQGNRLDWTSSGLVWGLMLAGAVLLVAFYVHDSRAANSWLNLRAALASPMPIIVLLVATVRSVVIASAYLIPTFLGVVRGFRALDIGDTLLWVGGPQLLLCPLAGFLLRYIDPRLSAATGFALIACAGLLVAWGMTPLWGSREFLPSQLIQAVGQSLALTGVIYAAVLNLRFEVALTFGAMVQTARLFGGEIGQAFIVTFQRIREQRASNLLGLHVQSGAEPVVHRLHAYAAVVARTGHLDAHAQAAASLLGRSVRVMATTDSVIDGFMAMTMIATGALLVLALLRIPKTAAAPAVAATAGTP
jgi:MFS transporter, DHA2 family, multidrug resistance protein